MKEVDRITRDLAGKKKNWSEWEGTWDRGGMMGRWERGKKWELCYVNVMGEGRACRAGNKEREKREREL